MHLCLFLSLPPLPPPRFSHQKTTPGTAEVNAEADARVSGGTVPVTNKSLAEITVVGRRREPQAATTERSRSRNFNKRPPQWRRLQLAEPTGKAESEAAALPIMPGASRRVGARGHGAARAALTRPLPRAHGARLVFTYCPSDTGSSFRPRRRRLGPATGRGEGKSWSGI